MTKEEIVKELDELGNVLYNKFGTDSYLERCTIHDLKAKIKALFIADVVVPKGTLCDKLSHNADILMSGECSNCGCNKEMY